MKVRLKKGGLREGNTYQKMFVREEGIKESSSWKLSLEVRDQLQKPLTVAHSILRDSPYRTVVQKKYSMGLYFDLQYSYPL